ncbi:hypothetical protein [Streptomyces sp. MUM 2J]|uniref:hypothetical protein n=1 Tax=Streptomyces sp. MUM 2J TaxID=2791987 RepID=UPI001F04F219|nr:hypothetical protein [Streptomyces sp. MUM 2J]MCH0566151.1 hypothetical protein [Streptomyces sp. MUM 2J]
MTDRPVVALVDAYSNARLLVSPIRMRGYEIVHVQSSAEIPEWFESSFRRDDFRDLVVHNRHFMDTVDRVSSSQPVAVLPGLGTGVELAADLSAHLGLRNSGMRKSVALQNTAEIVSQTGFKVHSVSLDGVHYICDIWEMRQSGSPQADGRPRGAMLLARRGVRQDRLVDLTLSGLDAAGLRNGPACTEFEHTAHGPVQGAPNAGICATDEPLLTREAIGEGQADWTVFAYLAPEWFRLRASRPYRRLRHAAWVSLATPAPGSARFRLLMRELKALESYHGSVVGGAPPVTRVQLLHTEEKTVVRDYAAALAAVELYGEGPWTSAI